MTCCLHQSWPYYLPLTFSYWRKHMRSAVKFAASVKTLIRKVGVDACIEMGPHPILCGGCDIPNLSSLLIVTS